MPVWTAALHTWVHQNRQHFQLAKAQGPISAQTAVSILFVSKQQQRLALLGEFLEFQNALVKFARMR